MADEAIDAGPGASAGSLRRGWASIGAVVATLVLVLLITLVTYTNRAREDALALERRTQTVVLLTRNVGASIARAEAALGHFVLDEERNTGILYYNEWRRAGRQIDELKRIVRAPEQRANIEELERLYRARGEEFANAANLAGQRTGSGGVNYFYQAGQSPMGPALNRQLDVIAEHARDALDQRIEVTRFFDQQAQDLTEWLSWIAVAIGLGAIVLGLLAWRAVTDEQIAMAEADTEAIRAGSLETAVQERTRELIAANERIRAEAAEREAAEAKLYQVQKMEAVGQLTGGIAHDFNNMLAVIVGGLELARRKMHGDRREAEFHLENAMEGANRAAALTRRLLAFSRSEALEPEPVEPAGLVEGMLDLLDRALGERITIETRLPAEPWHVWADSNLLENAVLNLSVNARDAMDGEGTLVIAIDNRTLAKGDVGELGAGDYVCLTVSDSGCGIPPEHLDRVFEPFFTTKPVGKGTGLGLSQIFGFARQSGGDVTIRSEVGVGTSVTICLPRSIREIAAAEAPAPELRPERDGDGAPVLVVEDDPRVSRATVAALEELGFHPIAASSGSEALSLLAEGADIRLLVTDMMMPEMTGAELVRIVADRYPDVAVLFVSGFVGEAAEAEELAGYPLLRKPFTVAALAAGVDAALARKVSESRPASTSEAAE